MPPHTHPKPLGDDGNRRRPSPLCAIMALFSLNFFTTQVHYNGHLIPLGAGLIEGGTSFVTNRKKGLFQSFSLNVPVSIEKQEWSISIVNFACVTWLFCRNDVPILMNGCLLPPMFGVDYL